MASLLLHSCCGPCSTAVIERLISEYDFDITVFYYNPNITDHDEYLHRRDEQIRFIKEFSSKTKNHISFVEGEYDPSVYYDYVKGFENEPEGGLRCKLCFRLRMEKAAEYAKAHGFDYFDTTLSVSPHKNYDFISAIGKELEQKYLVKYLDGNYKKKEGFKRSTELSKEYSLYRQNYCGCSFSDWTKLKDEVR